MNVNKHRAQNEASVRPKNFSTKSTGENALHFQNRWNRHIKLIFAKRFWSLLPTLTPPIHLRSDLGCACVWSKKSKQSSARGRGCGGVVAQERVEREGHGPDWWGWKNWRGQWEHTSANRWECLYLYLYLMIFCALYFLSDLPKICSGYLTNK